MVDGDTIEVRTRGFSDTVRFPGINTPEPGTVGELDAHAEPMVDGRGGIYRTTTHHIEGVVADCARVLAARTLLPRGIGEPHHGLTPYQWRGVRLALNAGLSLVTGGAGTGKCVHPATPVFIDGRLIEAEPHRVPAKAP